MSALSLKEAHHAGYLSELNDPNPYERGSDEYYSYNHGRNMSIQDSLLNINSKSILEMEDCDDEE